MKLSNLLLVLSVAATSFVVGAKDDAVQLDRELRRKKMSTEKPHFIHIMLSPFSGEGTNPIPIDSDGAFIAPGATVVLLEHDLSGTATYYYDDPEDTKQVSIVAQITGSCTIVNEEALSSVEVLFTSHCTVCVSYVDEQCAASAKRRELWGGNGGCSHPARGVITATGDILSRYLFDGTPPLGVSLQDSSARLVVTGGTHDAHAANSAVYDMIHDGKWNMVMKIPLTEEAAGKLQDYEYN